MLAVGVILGGVACGQSPAQSSASTQDNSTTPVASATSNTLDAQMLASPVTLQGAKSALARAHEDTTVFVVVELSGDPVAIVQANAPGQKISQDTVETVASDLKAMQRPIVNQIEAMGGTVMATYQHAMNGIKVRIPESRVASLTQLPGVVKVRNVAVYQLMDDVSLLYIGAPAAWQGANGFAGFHGEGVNVVDIDTGIDFTHADFNGPGTTAAYSLAHDNGAEKLPANPALFGPAAPRVKGGTDLVGDHY